MDLAAATPMQARVVERRDDGTAIVEVPIITVTESLDLSRTSGGGKASVSITRADLLQMAANFASWPKPVPVGFDGFDGHVGDRGGPQMAFVNSMRVEGDALIAQIELGSVAAQMVVTDRAFRAFSMEAVRDPVTATKSLSGWVIRGGVFTNNPATDTQFRIAASDGVVSSAATANKTREIAFRAPDRATETEMAEQNVSAGAEKTVSLTFHEKELSKKIDEIQATAGQVTSLTAALSGAESKVATLTAKADEATAALALAENDKSVAVLKANRLEVECKNLRGTSESLQVSLTEAQKKLETQEKANLSAKVEQVVGDAITAGVAPAFFDGYQDNPATWMLSQYATVEAFEQQVLRLTSLASGKAVIVKTPSGHDPATANKTGVELTEDEQKILDNIGGTDYVGVTTREEAAKKFKAIQAASKE